MSAKLDAFSKVRVRRRCGPLLNYFWTLVQKSRKKVTVRQPHRVSAIGGGENVGELFLKQ